MFTAPVAMEEKISRKELIDFFQGKPSIGILPEKDSIIQVSQGERSLLTSRSQ
jgi:hypothetical protein